MDCAPVGVPEMAPVPGSNVSPVGKDGEIAKLEIGPPVFVTTVVVIAEPTKTLCIAPVVIAIFGRSTTVSVKVAVEVPPLGPVAVTV